MRAARNILRAAALAVMACALGGCTLSAALRQDEIRSVWGPGRTLPAPAVFFATDRQAEGKGFSQSWSGTVHCGRADVPISNAVTAPAPDPVLVGIGCDTPETFLDFTGQIARAAKDRKCDRVLVIVHGFNLTFRNAMLHGAQIAMDTQWQCATLLLNWSSEGMFNRYAADVERSGYAVPLLLELVRGLKAHGVTPDILGHSMGARIALSAVAALCNAPAPLVGEMILMAPDVSAAPGNDDFGRLLARDMRCTRRATIYASDYDLALMASQSIHGGVPRAGQQPLQNLQYQAQLKNVDAVDATFGPGDPSGHAYFVFAYEALKDMMWLLNGATLAERAERHGTLACLDAGASRCAAGGGRYVLKVAKDRQPSLGRTILRTLWPLILPFQ